MIVGGPGIMVDVPEAADESTPPPFAQPRSASNRRRAESFGSVAADYDAVRPRYPDALFDRLLSDRADIDVLDVGCGTGIATRALADRGAHVLGLEIDERMAELARARGGEVATAPFETWPDDGRRFDLITAGQAWHWIDPIAGPVRAADLLRPGGRLALFWNYNRLTDAQQAALVPVYRAIAPDLVESVTLGQGAETIAEHRSDLEQSGRFVDFEEDVFEWSRHYTRDEWLALLGTHSDYLVQDPATRAELFGAIGTAIERLGGGLDIAYDTHLLLAHRRN
jgi:SAM-dependent methyltransferase